MYVQDWESFYQQAEELYRRRPLETRYCIKYRHQEGQLVLKVTDDVVVSTFGEQLHRRFLLVHLSDVCHSAMCAPAVPEVQNRPTSRHKEDGEAERHVLCTDGAGQLHCR